MSATTGWASVLQTYLPAILVLVSLPLLTAGMIQSLPLLVCLGIFPGIVAVYFFSGGLHDRRDSCFDAIRSTSVNEVFTGISRMKFPLSGLYRLR